MITIKPYIRLLLVIIICVHIFACSHDLSSSSDFLIRVDSINLPDTVNSGTAFNITFFGTIGYDDCVTFKTFNQIHKDNDITIEAWATYIDKGGKCNDALVSLNGRQLTMTIALPGDYNIIIRESGNLELNKQITVN